MKKFSVVLFILCAILVFSACEKTEYPTFEEKGMELVDIIEEMINSEEYLEVYGVRDEDVLGLIKDAAEGDYSEAEHIYELKFDNLADDMVDNYNKLPRSLKDMMKNRAYGAYISSLNSVVGSTPLVAASMTTASSVFATDKDENTIYIYTFEEGFPIAVTFVVNDEGICSASGTFLFGADNYDFSSAKKLEKSLDDDVKVEKIK